MLGNIYNYALLMFKYYFEFICNEFNNLTKVIFLWYNNVP